MNGFSYTELLPLGADDTTYRLVTRDAVLLRQAVDVAAGSVPERRPHVGGCNHVGGYPA